MADTVAKRLVLFGIGSYCGGLAAGEGMRHVGISVGNVSDALGMAKGAVDAARDRLHLPLFFAFDWPTPPITDDEFADLESEMERHPIGSYTMHESPPRGPCIELKATNLDDARAEAVEHWRHRTGLTDADEPPSGYAVLDLYGGCLELLSA